MIYSEAFFSDSDRRHEWIKLRSLLFDGLIKGGRRKKYGTDKRRETNSDGHHRDKHGRRNFKAIENGGTNFKAIRSTVRSGGNRSDTDKRGKIYSEGNNRGKTDSKEREKIESDERTPGNRLYAFGGGKHTEPADLRALPMAE